MILSEINESHEFSHMQIFVVQNSFYTVSPDSPLTLQWEWLVYETSINLPQFCDQETFVSKIVYNHFVCHQIFTLVKLAGKTCAKT